MTALDALGWTDEIAQAYAPWAEKPGFSPGRVFIGFNYIYRVVGESGEMDAVLAGRVKHHASSRGELPAVGDWVVIRRQPDDDRGAIVAVLPRLSRFSGGWPGRLPTSRWSRPTS